jgi:hypothetical protein
MEIIAVYFGHCTKNINALCAQITEFIIKVGDTYSNLSVYTYIHPWLTALCWTLAAFAVS